MEPETADATTGASLELDDIQAGALYERPSPYVGTYLLLRIDDRADGRELVRRLHRIVNPAGGADTPDETSITVAFTYHGLEALGVPQASLDSFAPEFRQGMAARAEILGDVGESAPDRWEKPLGTTDVHVAIAVLSSDDARLQAVAERAREAHAELPGVELIWRQECYQLATGRTSFGFKDGIGQPAVEGTGRQSTNPRQRALKAGEIILGYPDETGELPPTPTPDVLGRWQSGAPLALSPDQDDPELGSDPARNNDFGFGDDPRGFKCPVGAHARRANPRDALDDDGSVDVRLHRMIRRGTSYGPVLPDGVTEDDGIDRGIIFVFAGAHLKRQFEFVKTQWLNDGIFIGSPLESDPLVGPHDDSGSFTIPQRPIRRRLQDLPPFVVTRGGEYCFAPSLSALRWIGELDT